MWALFKQSNKILNQIVSVKIYIYIKVKENPTVFWGRADAVDLVWDGSRSGGTKEAASSRSAVRGQHLSNVTHTLSV